MDISPADAYAVTTLGEILHWNGTTWTALNATTQTGAAVTGSAVAALSPTDVSITSLNTLDNFNGTTWTSVPVPATTGLAPAGQVLASPDAAAADRPRHRVDSPGNKGYLHALAALWITLCDRLGSAATAQ